MIESKNIPTLRFQDFDKKWQMRLFSDYFEFSTTNSFSRDKLNYSKGKIKNIHYGDIHTKFRSQFNVLDEDVPFINDDIDTSKIKSDQFLKKGDIIIADASEGYEDIGKSIEIISLDNQKVVSGLHTLHAKSKNKIYLGFGSFLMKCPSTKKSLMMIAQGSKVLGISYKRVSQISLYLPCLQEQQKITNFLTAVDKRIYLLEKKKNLLETYKKGVMKKIFKQEIRFKDENGKDFPDWEKKKVKEIFNITRGNVLSVKNMSDIKTDDFCYPVYSSQTKNNGIVGFFNEYLFHDSLTWTTDGANAGDVNYRKGKFYCTNVCGVLISKDGFANPCIANLINSVSRKYVSYVGNPKLMNGVMADIKVNFPSIDEQQKISSFIITIDNQIELLVTQIDKSKTWKKGLLQKMFV